MGWVIRIKYPRHCAMLGKWARKSGPILDITWSWIRYQRMVDQGTWSNNQGIESYPRKKRPCCWWGTKISPRLCSGNICIILISPEYKESQKTIYSYTISIVEEKKMKLWIHWDFSVQKCPCRGSAEVKGSRGQVVLSRRTIVYFRWTARTCRGPMDWAKSRRRNKVFSSTIIFSSQSISEIRFI